MEHDIRVIWRIRCKEPFAQPATNRNHQRDQNDNDITQHPKSDDARAFALAFGRWGAATYAGSLLRCRLSLSALIVRTSPWISREKLEKARMCSYTLALVRAESHSLPGYLVTTKVRRPLPLYRTSD